MASGADVYAVGLDVFHEAGAGAFAADPDAPRTEYAGVWLSPTHVWVGGGDATVIRRPR